MAGAKKTHLLPVGEKIQNGQLKIERRLDAGGLTAEIYEGYLEQESGAVHVAVKAMKALEFSAARQLFAQESETLAFLMHLEEEANREQGISLKVAPVYYGRGEYEGTPYFVMEFVEGKKILNLLTESKEGAFSESQALIVAWHLYRTLDVMHHRLQKTYIDLKFENLWWVEPNEKAPYGQLKLTDFGTLEDIRPGDTQRRGVARDLLLAAVYFCKMATGYTPAYSLGELRRFNELKQKLRDAQVTWGTKRELKYLLHRDPAQRPKDAAFIAARLRTLVDFWTLPPQRVLEVAKKALERAQADYDERQELSEKGREAAYRAKSAFEILSIRAPELKLSHEYERLHVLLKSADHLELGKNLLRGRSYDLAKKVFKEGMVWEEEAATLRRWAYLAELGEQISPTAFESIQALAFEALEGLFPRGLWEDAITQIKKIHATLGTADMPAGLSYLFAEANLFREATLADAARDRDDFAEAESHYRAAQSFFEQLPEEYQDNIRENDLGDLKQSAIDMLEAVQVLKRKEEIDRKFKDAVDFFRRHGFEEDGKTLLARREAQAAVREAIALGYHPERLHEVTRAALGNKNYLEAYRLAQIALLGSPPADPLDATSKKLPALLENDLNLAAALFHAQQALVIPDGWLFAERLRQALQYVPADEIAKAAVQDLIGQAERKAAQLQNADLYAALSEACKEAFPDRAEGFAKTAQEIHSKQSAERHRQVDDLLARAEMLRTSSLEEVIAQVTDQQHFAGTLVDALRIVHSKKERYEHRKQILQTAEALAQIDGYRLEEIRNDIQSVQKEINTLSVTADEMSRRRAEAYERSLDKLNRWWLKLETLRQWREHTLELFGDSEPTRAIYRPLFNEAMDFLIACYSTLQGDELSLPLEQQFDQGEPPPPAESRAALHVLIENAHRLLNSLGPDAWRAIHEQSADALRKIDSARQDARNAFEAGDLPRALAYLEQAKRLTPALAEDQEWKTLRDQTLRILLWKRWQDEQAEALASTRYDPRLLAEIRRFRQQAIPAVYWENSAAARYLRRIEEALGDKFRTALTDPSGQKFVETLQEGLDVSWTMRYSPEGTRSWNVEKWLLSIYPRFLARDVNGLVNSIRHAPLPEHIPLALENVNLPRWQAMVAEKERERKNQEQRERRSKLVWIGSIAAGLLVLVLAINTLGPMLLGPMLRPASASTPTPTLPLTATLEPTLTPTTTPTETPSPTPTPIPPSAFLADMSSVRPILPVAAEQVWIIPPQNAQVTPPLTPVPTTTSVWAAATNTPGETYYYTKQSVQVRWQTDQPLYAGLYAVFILDPSSRSGGLSLSFQVDSDGQPLTPWRGWSSATFKTAQTDGQQADEWLPLGVYQVESGRRLGISVQVPKVEGNAYFGLSKLAIAKLSEPQRMIYEALPSERVLVAFADDTAAKIFLGQKGGASPTEDQVLQMPFSSSWGGTFRELPLDTLEQKNQKVIVEWTLPGVLPAGKYQLLAWIPAGSTAQGEFSLLAKEVATKQQPLPSINQADWSNAWWVGDIWTLKDPAVVSVQLTVDPTLNAGRILGIDAVVLVKVE